MILSLAKPLINRAFTLQPSPTHQLVQHPNQPHALVFNNIFHFFIPLFDHFISPSWYDLNHSTTPHSNTFPKGYQWWQIISFMRLKTFFGGDCGICVRLVLFLSYFWQSLPPSLTFPPRIQSTTPFHSPTYPCWFINTYSYEHTIQNWSTPKDQWTPTYSFAVLKNAYNQLVDQLVPKLRW